MPAPQGAGWEVRASRVGGSEVAALVEPGCHPYTTPADIYARIVEGRTRPVSGTRVRLGIDLEAYVAGRWSEKTGRKVMRAWRTLAHPEVPLAATPDYYVPHRELLEVKVDRGGPSDDWVDLPRYVYWQCVAQLAVTGRDACHVAALVGSDVRTFTVERDPQAEARLILAVHTFDVGHLTPRIPPPEVPRELVLVVAPRSAEVEDATGRMAEVGPLLVEVAAAITEAEAAREALREEMTRYMADRGLALLRGEGWTAEVLERQGRRYLTVRDLTRTYRRTG